DDRAGSRVRLHRRRRRAPPDRHRRRRRLLDPGRDPPALPLPPLRAAQAAHRPRRAPWSLRGRFRRTPGGEGAGMHWIWFIIVGAVVGALGRLIHPGRDPMGWLLTIAVGIVAMIIAAAISSGWVAFAIGVIIAALLVMLIGRFTGG